eukprot:CFRG5831T1
MTSVRQNLDGYPLQNTFNHRIKVGFGGRNTGKDKIMSDSMANCDTSEDMNCTNSISELPRDFHDLTPKGNNATWFEEMINRVENTYVYIKDRSGYYVMINKNFAEKFQIRGDCKGKSDKDFLPEAVCKQLMINDQGVMQSGEDHEILEEVPFPGQGCRTFMSWKFPLYGPDGMARAMGGISIELSMMEFMRMKTNYMQGIIKSAVESEYHIEWPLGLSMPSIHKRPTDDEYTSILDISDIKTDEMDSTGSKNDKFYDVSDERSSDEGTGKRLHESHEEFISERTRRRRRESGGIGCSLVEIDEPLGKKKLRRMSSTGRRQGSNSGSDSLPIGILEGSITESKHFVCVKDVNGSIVTSSKGYKDFQDDLAPEKESMNVLSMSEKTVLRDGGYLEDDEVQVMKDGTFRWLHAYYFLLNGNHLHNLTGENIDVYGDAKFVCCVKSDITSTKPRIDQQRDVIQAMLEWWKAFLEPEEVPSTKASLVSIENFIWDGEQNTNRTPVHFPLARGGSYGSHAVRGRRPKNVTEGEVPESLNAHIPTASIDANMCANSSQSKNIHSNHSGEVFEYDEYRERRVGSLGRRKHAFDQLANIHEHQRMVSRTSLENVFTDAVDDVDTRVDGIIARNLSDNAYPHDNVNDNYNFGSLHTASQAGRMSMSGETNVDVDGRSSSSDILSPIMREDGGVQNPRVAVKQVSFPATLAFDRHEGAKTDLAQSRYKGQNQGYINTKTYTSTNPRQHSRSGRNSAESTRTTLSQLEGEDKSSVSGVGGVFMSVGGDYCGGLVRNNMSMGGSMNIDPHQHQYQYQNKRRESSLQFSEPLVDVDGVACIRDLRDEWTKSSGRSSNGNQPQHSYAHPDHLDESGSVKNNNNMSESSYLRAQSHTQMRSHRPGYNELQGYERHDSFNRINSMGTPTNENTLYHNDVNVNVHRRISSTQISNSMKASINHPSVAHRQRSMTMPVQDYIQIQNRGQGMGPHGSSALVEGSRTEHNGMSDVGFMGHMSSSLYHSKRGLRHSQEYQQNRQTQGQHFDHIRQSIEHRSSYSHYGNANGLVIGTNIEANSNISRDDVLGGTDVSSMRTNKIAQSHHTPQQQAGRKLTGVNSLDVTRGKVKRPETLKQFVAFAESIAVPLTKEDLTLAIEKSHQFNTENVFTHRFNSGIRRIQGDTPDSLRGQFNLFQQSLAHEAKDSNVSSDIISSGTAQTWFAKYLPQIQPPGLASRGNKGKKRK